MYGQLADEHIPEWIATALTEATKVDILTIEGLSKGFEKFCAKRKTVI